MERDFSKRAYDELCALAKEAADDRWCAATDRIGDLWYEFEQWIGILNISHYLDDLSSYHKKIIDMRNVTEEGIERIFAEVNILSDRYGERFRTLTEETELLIGAIRHLTASLSEGGDAAVLKRDLRGFIASRRNMREGFLSGIPEAAFIFDDIGSYGGDQGSAMRVYQDEEIENIVRRYHPRFTDKEVLEFLKRLNAEGCGYVALCNTLFNEYACRQARFEEKFGFPMYKDGELNYNALIVDLYCSEDDSGQSGTTADEREVFWEKYLGEHGIKTDVVCDIEVTPENYGELTEDGMLIVAVSPVILEDSGGALEYWGEGGHAMTVTGVTDDGRYVVSSWGKKYYLNPKRTFDRISFQQVRY